MKLSNHQVEQVCNKLNEELIRFSFLAKGNHNSNYLLETKKSKYVLRIEDNQQFKNLKKEYRFLKLAKQGLGPKVFSFDNSHKIIPIDYLIEEFIEGKHPSEEHPSDNSIMQMAKWFKRLHQTTKKAPKSYFLRTKVKPYYENYLKYKDHVKDNTMKTKMDYYISEALKILGQNNDIFASRKTISLLHNDTSSGNIFNQDGHVRLIDWEFVDYGLPERELVYFLDSYHLTKNQQSLFLKSYGYPNTKIANVKLSMAYIILLFSSIGYSLWQLDILFKNKSSQKDKTERMKRLIRDVNLLREFCKIGKNSLLEL